MATELTPDARNLLAWLQRGGTYSYYWLTSEAKKIKDGKPTDQPAEKLTTWYSVGQCPALPVERNGHGPRHLYYGVHPVAAIPERISKKTGQAIPAEYVRAQIADIAAINCLFGEFDEAHAPFALQPSVTVESSPGKLHCYWLLPEPYLLDTTEKRDYARRVQAGWVAFVGSDEDAKDLARVLRIPGTPNVKSKYGPNYPIVKVVEADYSRLYTLDELAQACAAFISSPRGEQSSSDQAQPATRDDREWAEHYLSRLASWRADTYNEWLAVGMALKGLGLHGLARWDDWSRQSSKWQDGACESKWATFSTDPHGIAKLGAWANEDDPNGKRQRSEDTRRGIDMTTGEILSDDDDEPPVHTPMSSCPALPAFAHLPDELGRDACPLLDEYIAFSRQWSPRSYDDFHEACILWILSTIAARRIVTHLGGLRYSNLYIALCARTSLWAKSTVAKIAMETIRAAGLTPLLAPDDSTPQAFVANLSTRVPADYDSLTPDRQTALEQRLAFAAQRGWYYEEFGQKISAMMRENGTMADYRSLLRRLDDCPERYESATIGRGIEEMNRPYLALLASLTPADMAPFAKRNGALWADGFFARFGFVTPPVEADLPMGKFPQGERVIPATIVTALHQWHERLGVPLADIVEVRDEKGEDTGAYQVHITSHDPQRIELGTGVFEAFYRYDDALRLLTQQNTSTDLDGNYARFSEKALRIAMLLASVDNNNVIEMRHWARAQQIAERWRRNLHALIDQLQGTETQSREAELEDKVMQVLQQMGQATIRDLRSSHLRSYSTDELERVLDSMERHGRVTAELNRKKTKRYTPNETNRVNRVNVNRVNDENSYTIQSETPSMANRVTENDDLPDYPVTRLHDSLKQPQKPQPPADQLANYQQYITRGDIDSAWNLVGSHRSYDWSTQEAELMQLEVVR